MVEALEIEVAIRDFSVVVYLPAPRFATHEYVISANASPVFGCVFTPPRILLWTVATGSSGTTCR